MVEVVAIVEGETEQTFVRDQLAPHLMLMGTNIWAVLPGRNRKKGGVKKWQAAKDDILRTLKEGRYCTTMFDFFGMPNDWPGRSAAGRLPWDQRASHVEKCISDDIVAASGINPEQLISYVQLHEFEALAFADVQALAAVTAPLSRFVDESQLSARYQEILASCGQPEAINDGDETFPSRRIMKLVPAYQKRSTGPIITQRVGISVLRERCKHFGDWLGRLEQLAQRKA